MTLDSEQRLQEAGAPSQQTTQSDQPAGSLILQSSASSPVFAENAECGAKGVQLLLSPATLVPSALKYSTEGF